MKKLSKSELKTLADKYFVAHPKVEVFLATEDGNFFPEDKKSQADYHAKVSKSKLFTFKKDDENDASDEKPAGKPISKMTTAELEAKAKELGLSLDDAKNNGERAALIEEHLKHLEEGKGDTE